MTIVRHCSDSCYGEYDCAFCDACNWGEESIISVGDKCSRCQATVISVSIYSYKLPPRSHV